MDQMITVEKDDEGDWDDLLPTLAVPIRATEPVVASAAAAAAAVGGSIAAVTSDDPRLVKINEILDEKVRPALMLKIGRRCFPPTNTTRTVGG